MRIRDQRKADDCQSAGKTENPGFPFRTEQITESINNRLKQLVKTVVAILPDKNIYLYIEGKQVDVMGGDGVMNTQPLNVSDFNF